MSRFELLMTEGIKVPGKNGYRLDQKPEWYDSELYAKGRDVIRKYYLGYLCATTLGHIILSQYDHLMEPLVTFGNFKTLKATRIRLANTLMHIIVWINGDLFNPNDPAYQSLRKVRGIHHSVAKKLHEVVPNRKDGGVWLSQFEMAITVFANVGPVFIYSEKLGIYATEDELKAVALVWRAVGRQLGMMDEFNPCQGSIQEIKSFCSNVVEMAKPTLLNPKKEYSMLLKYFLTALKDFSLFIDETCLWNWTCELIDLEKTVPLTWYGQLCNYAIQIHVKLMLFGVFRNVFSPWYSAKVRKWASDCQSKSNLNGQENLKASEYRFSEGRLTSIP